MAAVLTFVGALLAGSVGSAQPLEPSVDEGESGVSGTVSVGLGAERIAEDWYLVTSPALLLTIPDVTLARDSAFFGGDVSESLRLLVQAPLRFRVKDNPPRDDDGAFRRQDWDEAAEFLRIVRWIEYGHPYGGVYWRAGELANVRIGHRTIVDNYINSLELDHHQWGLHGSLNSVYGGVELLLDNFADPDVMGLRVYARPWAFVDQASYWNRLAVGMSFIGDQNAPLDLLTTADGTAYARDRGDFVVERSSATGLLGWDVELNVVDEERVTVTPYTDANTHLSLGSGWHLGSFFGFKLTDAVVLDMRAEYRLAGRHYLPGYIGTLYEIERSTYLPIDNDPARSPKLKWLQFEAEALRHGYYAELGFNFGNKVFLSAGWEDLTGANNNAAWAQLRLPALSIVQVGAHFANTRFEGASGLFDLDNAFAAAEIRFMVQPWLFVEGQLRRRWQLDDAGQYEPVDDYAFGAGVSFGF